MDGLVVDFVVVEVQLLDGGACRVQGLRDGFEAVVSNAVVLNAQLDQLALAFKAVFSDFDSAAAVEFVV
jgi:outer membrane murein-binding lipoprotein Lpp